MKQLQPSSRGAVTLSEIARVTRFDKSTVSLALRNHPRIPPVTRDRIQRAAEKLGFAPDPFLRVFSRLHQVDTTTHSAEVIAFLSDQSSARVFALSRRHHELFLGAKEKAEQHGGRVELFLIGAGQLTPSRLDGILAARGITKVIVGALSSAQTTLALDWSGLCAVGLDSLHLTPQLDNLVLDYRNAARIAVVNLRVRGARRVGVVLAQQFPESLAQQLRAGYLTECNAAGLRAFPFLESQNFPDKLERRKIGEWAKRHRFEAILAGDQKLAETTRASLVSGTEDERLVIASLEVAVGDQNTLGVREEYRQLGARAVELLNLRAQSHLRGLPEHASRILIPPKWCEARAARQI